MILIKRNSGSSGSGGSGGGGGVVVNVVVVVLMVVVVGVSSTRVTTTTTTTTGPPHAPPPPTTAEVMTEAPPPRPSELRMRPADCRLYVLGELKTIKKHGETWLNDGNACELCKCDQGLKRCYYHYCNQRTEVVNAGRPPLDDEDGGEGGEEEGEEGSGSPPLPPPYHLADKLKTYRKSGPEEEGAPAEDNDTLLPAFCVHHCSKACPWGYKMDPARQCRQCLCRRRCHDLNKCQLKCPEGLATDSHGCPMCQCRGEGHGGRRPHTQCNDTSVRGCVDGSRIRQVGEVWSRGACVSCKCVVDGYTECNVTQCPDTPPCPRHYTTGPITHSKHNPCCPICQAGSGEHIHDLNKVGRAEVTVQSAWERQQLTYAPQRTPTPQHGSAASDGAVKSAVQAEVMTWWQMVLIMVPLAVVCVVGAACALKHWRRAHHDKYDINSYRMPPPLTEKLRPVTTAADHVRGRLM